MEAVLDELLTASSGHVSSGRAAPGRQFQVQRQRPQRPGMAIDGRPASLPARRRRNRRPQQQV